jgi:hypothetical protein
MASWHTRYLFFARQEPLTPALSRKRERENNDYRARLDLLSPLPLAGEVAPQARVRDGVR